MKEQKSDLQTCELKPKEKKHEDLSRGYKIRPIRLNLICDQENKDLKL